MVKVINVLAVGDDELSVGRGRRRVVAQGHVRAGDGWGLGSRGSPAPVGQEGDFTNIPLSHEEVKRDTCFFGVKDIDKARQGLDLLLQEGVEARALMTVEGE